MNQGGYTIRLETPDDYRAAENLTREAFWNVYRPGCIEHYILHAYRGREDFVQELDFVMEKDGGIMGHIMYVRTEIQADDGRRIPIMTFGPISIAPEYQRQGYGKLGFVVASSRGIHYNAEPRTDEVPYFLLRELRAGFLNGVTGTYYTPEGYLVDGRDVENFDAGFSPKKKMKLPGQLV